MKKVKDVIDRVQFVNYEYNDMKEFQTHKKEMWKDGFELLDNPELFTGKLTARYRKWLDNN